MGKMHDFFKCGKCGKELAGTTEQRHVIDGEGFTHVYCEECFKTAEK